MCFRLAGGRKECRVARGGEGVVRASPPKWCISLLFTLGCLELSHMAIANYGGSWEL